MKKRLESELISIAHRILKLKNKSEVDQLYKETQKLYETLTVLKFYQDNYESVKLDVSQDDFEEKLTQAIEKEEEAIPEPIKETVAIPGPEEDEMQWTTAEETIEEESVVAEEDASKAQIAAEETPEEEEPKQSKEEILAFTPIFELEEDEEPIGSEQLNQIDKDDEEVAPAETASEVSPETKKVVLETFLGEDYTDPVFVKPNEVSLFSSGTTEDEPKSTVVSETLSKSIAIGLNDRIGFVKHLFGDSSEDFNRVVSQLNTFDTFEEAKNFIEDMIKPDYNNWEGEEEYEERFMEVVEHKFK